MKLGRLNSLVAGYATKRLTPHEVDPDVSNGHEFQGVAELKALLGEEDTMLPAKYFLLSDDSPTVVIDSTAKWYDCRRNQPHRSPEWRLYYPADAFEIQSRMHAGDLMVIAKAVAGPMLVALAAAGSSREAQLKALFGIHEPADSLDVISIPDEAALSSLAVSILEELDLVAPAPEAVGDGAHVLSLVGELTSKYPDALPSGREIAALIQSRIHDVDPIADPDGTLVRWIEAEEEVFRLWEDGLIARRLDRGFRSADGQQDVQAFRTFAMSTRQSRVSRAGTALQLHASQIMHRAGIAFEEQTVTENREKPDFLFPGGSAYRDPTFPHDRLRMLAAKFTAKERWRQVLNEAERVRTKHLLTMDAAISPAQLEGMRAAHLVPVIPLNYHGYYDERQRSNLSGFRAFIEEVRSLQR